MRPRLVAVSTGVAGARTASMKRAAQVARRQHPGLGDETDWRDMLERVGGSRSLSAMNVAQLGKVLDHLNGRTGQAAAPVRGDKPHARKIARLWNVLELLGGIGADDVDGLAGFVQRQTGVASADWLSADQASSVIEALRARITRAGWAVPPGKAAIGDRAQRAYATALHARLLVLQATTDDRDTWLLRNAAVRAFGLASTTQVKAGVDALESAVRKAMKGVSNGV
ncbi:MAG: regulatory protein GemA [Desulfobulbaceae bacterium]|nr:MAG: regulatory protein GemA [Desulfobulbaceae bacterium]